MSAKMLGFGHGGAFGVTFVADGPNYLFTECLVNTSGSGKAVAYYPMPEDGTIDCSVPTATACTSAISPMYPFGVGGVVKIECTFMTGPVPIFVARYAYDGATYYNVWALDDAMTNVWSAPYIGTAGSPGTGFLEPTFVLSTESHEGMTISGQYLYILTKDDSNNPYLYTVDLNGTPGTYIARAPHSSPGSGGPEGLMIDNSNPSDPLLVYARKHDVNSTVNMYSVH